MQAWPRVVLAIRSKNSFEARRASPVVAYPVLRVVQRHSPETIMHPTNMSKRLINANQGNLALSFLLQNFSILFLFTIPLQNLAT